MLDFLDISKPFDRLDNPVTLEIERAIIRWVHAEARLLDAERYQEWLDGFIDPEIHYWMPDMETRRRDDPRGTFKYGESAYFDDNWRELEIRVKRYNEPSAWADNPATRHVHLISNIEVNATDDPRLFAVCSAFTNVRNRNEADQDIIHGRREDVLRAVDGGYRLLRRRVLIVQNVLLSKNLNTFF
jgi:ethylbenzene dioxygenase subunit beta